MAYPNIIQKLWSTYDTDPKALQKTGGRMTGVIEMHGANILGSSDDGGYTFCGGTGSSNGSSITLFGKDHSSGQGTLILRASNGSGVREMYLNPNGELTWDNKEVERVNSSGTGYIRYESGLQICYGIASFTANVVSPIGSIYQGAVSNSFTFPVAFVSQPRVSLHGHSRTLWSGGLSVGTTDFHPDMLWAGIAEGSVTVDYDYLAIGNWK